MVYPSEGLFYIEMDQTPPGKLGLKAAFVWSPCASVRVFKDSGRLSAPLFLTTCLHHRVILSAAELTTCTILCSRLPEQLLLRPGSCVHSSPQRPLPGHAWRNSLDNYVIPLGGPGAVACLSLLPFVPAT